MRGPAVMHNIMTNVHLNEQEDKLTLR